jgi:hypothetical protein
MKNTFQIISDTHIVILYIAHIQEEHSQPTAFTGSPQFAPIQNNADFETRRSKSEKKYILLLFITFYNFSRTASYTKS